MVVFAVATITVVGTATAYNPGQCIANVKEQKRLEAEQRIQELRKQREEQRKKREAEEAEQGGAQQSTPKPSNNSGFGNVFAPNTLGGDAEEESSDTETPPSNNGGFGGVFDPNSLQTDQ